MNRKKGVMKIQGDAQAGSTCCRKLFDLIEKGTLRKIEAHEAVRGLLFWCRPPGT